MATDIGSLAPGLDGHGLRLGIGTKDTLAIFSGALSIVESLLAALLLCCPLSEDITFATFCTTDHPLPFVTIHLIITLV
jgi:hypothetical protein